MKMQKRAVLYESNSKKNLSVSQLPFLMLNSVILGVVPSDTDVLTIIINLQKKKIKSFSAPDCPDKTLILLIPRTKPVTQKIFLAPRHLVNGSFYLPAFSSTPSTAHLLLGQMTVDKMGPYLRHFIISMTFA